MEKKYISDSIIYVGVDDKTLDLFESQYIIPNGVSYNSYLIKDEKNVLMDTVDKRKIGEWLKNVKNILGNDNLDYLVVSHLEPDHSAGIKILMDEYPKMKVVGNKKTFDMFPQFLDLNFEDRKVVVTEGEVLNIGNHNLKFFMAPMVHWPEVMVMYEQTERILFTADGFGKFGTLDVEEDWACEARRYYFNIVGKYGMQVQQLLKKVADLDIKMICPLHGPILKENIGYYINKYDIWSKYEPEDEGVFIAYNSIHGKTKEAVEKLVEILEKDGAKKVSVSDLARDDMAEAIEDAFRYDKLVIASPTYDAGLFPYMEKFLRYLKHKNYQNRKVAIIENGSWAPMAGKCMESIIKEMKNVDICSPIVTIKTTMNDKNIEDLKVLSKNILES